MKKLISFFICFLLILLSIFIVAAHPGGTDYKGGHRDSDTGIYHYHHGYSAHQHPNGECPYDFDDKTNTESGTSDSNSSSNLNQQSSVEDLKKLANSRLIYIIILFVVLILMFVALIHTNSQKSKAEKRIKEEKIITEENIRKLNQEIDNYKDELNYLRNEYNKESNSNCELIYEISELKDNLKNIEIKQNRDLCNNIHNIQTYIAEHFGLVSFPMLPSESLSKYFIRILDLNVKNPMHFTKTKFISKEQEKQILIYAKYIRFRYINKGYKVIIFESKYTKEKYLFAYNLTTLLLIQCVYTQEELSNVEHIHALNNSLVDFKSINQLDNINAILICSSSIKNEVKDLLNTYNFNYRENIELKMKKDK